MNNNLQIRVEKHPLVPNPAAGKSPQSDVWGGNCTPNRNWAKLLSTLGFFFVCFLFFVFFLFCFFVLFCFCSCFFFCFVFFSFLFFFCFLFLFCFALCLVFVCLFIFIFIIIIRLFWSKLSEKLKNILLQVIYNTFKNIAITFLRQRTRHT